MAELPQTNTTADPTQPAYSSAPSAAGQPDPTFGTPSFAPPAYQPAPAAYQPAPAGYPPAPAAYPPPGQPDNPVTPWKGDLTDAADATLGGEAGVEKVARGLLYSLGGVVVGMALGALVWQLGFVAGLTSLVMAYACIWLYTKGAGRSPRKGAMLLLLVILFGVFASLLAAFGSDAVQVAMKIYPGDTAAQLTWVVEYLTNPAVWKENTNEVLMYLVFAGLGSFGIFTGLAKSRGAE